MCTKVNECTANYHFPHNIIALGREEDNLFPVLSVFFVRTKRSLYIAGKIDKRGTPWKSDQL